MEKKFNFKGIELIIQVTTIQEYNEINNYYSFIIKEENSDELIFNLNLMNWNEMTGKLLLQLLHIESLSKENIIKIYEKIENEVLFGY